MSDFWIGCDRAVPLKLTVGKASRAERKALAGGTDAGSDGADAGEDVAGEDDESDDDNNDDEDDDLTVRCAGRAPCAHHKRPRCGASDVRCCALAGVGHQRVG